MSVKLCFLLSVLYSFASTNKLFKYLKLRYDHLIVQELNNLLRLSGRRVRSKERSRFLEKCLEGHVTPTFIKDRVVKTKPKWPSTIERAFLKDELEKERDLLEHARRMYSSLLPCVLQKISLFDRIRFSKLLNLTTDRLQRESRVKYDKTLKWLIKTQLGVGVLQHSAILNFSSIELSDMQKDVLCRGLGFGIPPSRNVTSFQAVASEFELCWQQLERLPTCTSDECRQECKASLASFAHQYSSTGIDRNGFVLSNGHLKVISDLRRNNDIVVTRPDKGNGVVLLDRKDYVDKMLSILSDESKFCRIGDAETSDSTMQHERALQAFLLRAVKNNHLPRDVYGRIRPVGSTRPRMYGLQKIHKPGVPLRPILSMINAPQHELAKWLSEVLKPVVAKYSAHTIRDTFQFCSDITEFDQQHGAKELFMCSFDVTSLFTNIPLEETIGICLDSLYRDPDVPSPVVPETLLRKLLFKATTEIEFSFDNIMYRQVDGVAMGSPLGPILANIFCGFCEAKINSDEFPSFYRRFVDDTFSIFQGGEECASRFFKRLNSVHPSLQFTMEQEHDDQLPFMDVLVKRHGNRLVRSIYRKPTFTGLYVRWDSFSPTDQKIAALRSLVSRAIKICSPEELENELGVIKSIFLNNAFPASVIDRTILRVRNQLQGTGIGDNLKNKGDGENNVLLRLPWIGPPSTMFRAGIRRAIGRGFPNASLRIVFHSTKAFSGRAKDFLPASSKSCLVYEFTCDCASTYVGRTSQSLAERISQHLPDRLFERATRSRKSTADSAITRHMREHPECINTDPKSRFKVLASARDFWHLEVLEALFIKARNPSLCAQKEHVRVLKLF